MGTRRLIHGLAVVAMVIVVAESASLAALWARLGKLPVPRLFALQRAEIAAAAGSPPPMEKAEAVAVPDHLRGEILHPYVGYVIDVAEADRLRQQWNWALSEHGFPTDRRRPEVPPDGAVRVAVVGGSVATILAVNGHLLVDELARLGAFDGRPVVIDGFALPGHKQPQQLLTVTWMLSLGQRPDVVVNLDGFNDLVLPLVENLPASVHPAYPRGWPERVGGLTDPEEIALAGEAMAAERRRGDLALAWSRLPLGGGMTGNLLWSSLDARHRQDRNRALSRLGGRRPTTTTMVATGPPWHGDTEKPVTAVVEQWRRSSLQLHRLCAANGIAYLHFLQPNQYLPGSKILSREELRLAVNPDSPYRGPVERGYPELRRVGGELQAAGVRFTDLTQLFAAERATVYRDACCHLNQHGHLQLVAAIAAELARTGLPAD